MNSWRPKWGKNKPPKIEAQKGGEKIIWLKEENGLNTKLNNEFYLNTS